MSAVKVDKDTEILTCKKKIIEIKYISSFKYFQTESWKHLKISYKGKIPVVSIEQMLMVYLLHFAGVPLNVYIKTL